MNFNGNGNNQSNGGGGGLGIIIIAVIFALMCFGSCSQSDSYDEPFSSGYHYYID